MKKKLGFLGSIVIETHGIDRLRFVYRPILLWTCACLLGLMLGIPFLLAAILSSEFRIFASVACFGSMFLWIDLIRHLGSVVTLDFDKGNQSFRYRRQLFASRQQQIISLDELVRVEAIAPKNLTPQLCVLLNRFNSIYINLFLVRSPNRFVRDINQFLRDVD